MGHRALLPWMPSFATKGVAGLASGSGCSCYKGQEALRQQAPVCATYGGSLRNERWGSSPAMASPSTTPFCCKWWVTLLPAAEGVATRGVQRCYLGDDVFSGEVSNEIVVDVSDDVSFCYNSIFFFLLQ
jgi:hypothetical protein